MMMALPYAAGLQNAACLDICSIAAGYLLWQSGLGYARANCEFVRDLVHGAAR